MRIIVTILFLLLTLPGFAAGKKIVILGSSTAYGIGPTNIANSWANRYTVYFTNLNAGNSVVNLAVPGYTTRDILTNASGIFDALTNNPDAIICALGNNDQGSAGMTVLETTNNYIAIASNAAAAHISLWLTTVTPRNSVSLANQAAVGSFQSNYFAPKIIDFWTTLDAGDGTVAAPYSYGDGIHFNDAGHLLMFQRVTNSGLYESLFAGTTTNITLVNSLILK